MRIHGLPAALALLAGCATAERGAPATAAGRVDQTAVIHAVADMARDGRLEDLPAIERRLRLRGLAAVKWEDTPYGKEEGQIALFTARPDSPLAALHLHRRRQDYFGGYSDSLRLTFKKDRCVSKAAAEAAFGKAFEVEMIPYPHSDGSYPYTGLTLERSDGRDIHVAFYREGCEIGLSWPSRPAG